MNYLDLFLILVLGGGAFWGFKKGFIRSVLGFAAIGLSLWIGFGFSEYLHGYVTESGFVSEDLVPYASIAVAIVLVYFAINLVAKILKKITRSLGLGLFDRLGGAAIGILLNMTTLSAGIYYAIPFFAGNGGTGLLAESKIYPYLNQIIELLKTNFFIPGGQ